MKFCGIELEGKVKEGEDCAFVPIHKFTVGLLLRTAEYYCEDCEEKKCDECCIKTAIKGCEWTLNQRPFMDGDFKLIQPMPSYIKNDPLDKVS